MTPALDERSRTRARVLQRRGDENIETPSRPTFAEKLAELRAAAGLTPQQLADKTGVPVATIKRFEAGANKRSPAWGLVVRLAAGVGVPCRVFSACWEQQEEA